MPRSKPLGWPDYMSAKRLVGGPTAYYWSPPTWARKMACPLRAEALGADYGLAKKRCDDVLNPQLTAWRTKGVSADPTRPLEGSFDWLVALYKTAPRYTKRPQSTRDDYDSALALVSKYELTDGRKFGTLTLGSITPGTADRLFAKLCIGKGDTIRARTAVMCVAVAKVAWNVAMRDRPDIVPVINPFAKVDISAYKPKETRPVTADELLHFVAAADAAGEPSIGTAAMIAFYWFVRQVDILSRLQWTAYRPKDAPDVVRVFHHKSGVAMVKPLYDIDGTVLYPELMERLDAAPRHGTLIVTRDKLDRNRKVHLPWNENYFRHKVSALREAAGIDAEVKFMGLRHGGNTAMADAGLTDAQIRSLSGHRTPSMTTLYAKETKKQSQTGARKMVEARTKRGNLSE
jgi:integrase